MNDQDSVNVGTEHSSRASIEFPHSASVEGLAGHDLVFRAQALLRPIAERYETKPEHWIHGWDEGFSFCLECAEKKVAELLTKEPNEDYLVNGGWGTEGDSQAFCETCKFPLDNSFTRYACEQELDHFESCGFTPNPDDCHSLYEILAVEGTESSELWPRIERLTREAVGQLTALGNTNVPAPTETTTQG